MALMIEHRCEKCIWWDNEHLSVQYIPATREKLIPGFCRKKRPNVIMFKEHYFGTQPVMDSKEFCGEFKGEQ